jgi:ABC-type transport system involved in multi-copper enzyme maturation permease subunit
MFRPLSLPFLVAQAGAPGKPSQLDIALIWIRLFGDPTITVPNLWGAALLWLKVVSLLCLVTWVATWVATAIKEWTHAGVRWLDYAALVGLGVGFAAAALQVLEQTKRVAVYKIGGALYLDTLLALIAGAILFLWVEAALWRSIVRLKRRADLAVLLGIHVGLAAGIAVGLLVVRNLPAPAADSPVAAPTWRDGVVYGARLSATFMGYVVFLRVFALVLNECVRVRVRRLVSIALLSMTESVRKMWAPWIVITVFFVILAFTHWFIQPPRPAEMGRLYVGTLSLLCSLLLTVMITILTPLSLPYDIQNQTIYTVVSKPVRRIELIWGRMIGYMTIVSILVVVFYGVSIVYLWRTVGGTIRETEALAQKEADAGRVTQANQLRDQADQLRTRMSARVPIPGSLTFLDSKGTAHLIGIDVGAEQGRHPRSHIEGATPAAAIWSFGYVRDPRSPQNRPVMLDRRIPVDELLDADSVEGLHNRVYDLQFQIARAEQARNDPKVTPERSRQINASITRNKEELERLNSAYLKRKSEADDLDAKANALPADRAAEADSLRRQAAALHSRPMTIEMSFNVYRTTKGRIGDPVYAQIQVINPNTGAEYRNIFPIREYYTNRQTVPASILEGSLGALRVEVHCISATQYLGMAENDLYILGAAGSFGVNFFKGLLGVWLQAMVLTAIGVFAGTFLSWPVALLTTIFFFIAGQVFFPYLLEFSNQSLLGGGPFESMIRMLSHENQMSDLAPTITVVTAKTLDSLVTPVMARLVYLVPNFSALDVSNTVSEGFYVSWWGVFGNLLLAVAYALPFSIAGYLVLKNREVAA